MILRGSPAELFVVWTVAFVIHERLPLDMLASLLVNNTLSVGLKEESAKEQRCGARKYARLQSRYIWKSHSLASQVRTT